MIRHKGILFFGLTEIGIGALTLGAVLFSIASGINSKPGNITVFVLTSSAISLSLGIGILLRMRSARKLLMFFAGWVILSKILILGRIITPNGALETNLNPDFKNAGSILYHLALILYFHYHRVKKEYDKS